MAARRRKVGAESPRLPAAARTNDDFLFGIIFPLFAIRGHLVELIEQSARDLDVTPTEAVALLQLMSEDMTVSEISHAAGLQRSGGSVLVDRLHARRLIKRTPDTRDRRVVKVSLTPSGGRIAAILLERLSSDAAGLLRGLGTAQRQRVVSGLQRLAELQMAPPHKPGRPRD
jgi:DNA-binding MarR family transcriptional regulator